MVINIEPNGNKKENAITKNKYFAGKNNNNINSFKCYTGLNLTGTSFLLPN